MIHWDDRWQSGRVAGPYAITSLDAIDNKVIEPSLVWSATYLKYFCHQLSFMFRQDCSRMLQNIPFSVFDRRPRIVQRITLFYNKCIIKNYTFALSEHWWIFTETKSRYMFANLHWAWGEQFFFSIIYRGQYQELQNSEIKHGESTRD